MESQRLLPQSLEDQVLGWMARAGGVALLAVVLATWISLVSWSNADPSLTHVTANAPRNWLGPLGAILADLLFQTLGFTATLILVIPLVWGLKLLRAGSVDAARSKLGFFPLAILAVAGALSALPVPAMWPLNHGLGGVLGDGMFKLVSRLFAVINEERAGFAAGLVLFAAAATSVARSLGTEIEMLMSALVRRAATADVGEMREALASTMGNSARRWWSPAALAANESHAASLSLDPDAYQTRHALQGAAADAHAERWGADAELREPHFGALSRAVPTGPQGEDAEAFRRGFSQGFDAAKAMREAYRAQPAATDHHPQAPGPDAAYAPQFVPHQLELDQLAGSPFADDHDADEAPREPDFDLHTDAASLAIAKRFAPGVDAKPSAKAEPVKAEPAPQRPAAKTRAGALFGARALQTAPAPAAESGWQRPWLNLLKRPPSAKPNPEFSQTALRGNARLLEDVLADFGVKGEVKDVRPGPVVTLYELEPSRGTKSSRVIGLADDIARSMSVVSVRAAVVPGRNAIGLELPNIRREPVLLREMLDAPAYKTNEFALPLALGKSISGDPIVADLARMPHLLVAGTTGSGKSVGVNAMVLSLLYRHAPEDCRLILIDPKMLELSVYNGIPHLLTPVVTDPQRAVAALNWAVREMEERYKRMAAISVRNIDMFNNRIRNARKRGEMLSRSVQTGFDRAGRAVFEKQQMDMAPLPHIVVVVDEFADLMAVAGKEVEAAVQRLAQMARAAGIHLIMATQRPSVDVITGTIKANFPTRISFKVTSKIDSRTILNEQGAEQLLGQGDMLFSTGAGQILRVHGAFVSDEEVEAVAAALRRAAPTDYVDGITDVPEESDIASGERQPSEGDLYDRAVAIVLRDRKASTSYLQRRLSIGYNRAADLIERMERDGLISPASATGKREILGGGNADAA